MSEASRLLAGLAEESGSFAGMGSKEEHIIISRDRSIFVPDCLKKIAVQHDHEVEAVTFDCPKMWDDTDLSRLNIYIVGRTADDKTFYRQCDTVQGPDNDTLSFKWLVSNTVTADSGQITFIVCMKEVDENGITLKEWHSDLCTDLYVSRGLNCSFDDIVNPGPDAGGSSGGLDYFMNDVYAKITELQQRTNILKSVTIIADGDGTKFLNDQGDYVTIASGGSGTVITNIISSFSVNKATTYEKGQSVSDLTFSWILKETPKTIMFDGESLDVTATSKTITDTLTSDKTYILKVVDKNNNEYTKSIKVSFVNAVYYGVSEKPELYDNDFILGFEKVLRSNKEPSITVTANDNQYVYYCLPYSYGECTFTVGGWEGGFVEETNSFSFTNSHGHTEIYRIYRSENHGLGRLTVKVS